MTISFTPRILTSLVLSAIAFGSAHASSVYKCTDANGSIAYQQAQCPNGAKQEEPQLREEEGRAASDSTSNRAGSEWQQRFDTDNGGAGIETTTVTLPSAWDHKSTLPVAIWLHGYRWNPSDVTATPFYQSAADRLGIAVVGVPGTNEEDSSTFFWANDTRLDGERIEEALREATKRTGAKFGRRALFGFSQGAVVALELAARFPGRYAGAIALSPGGKLYSPSLQSKALNHQQTYFISIGAGDLDRRVQLARQYQQVLSNLGAHVHYREVAGMNEHTRPYDWPTRFPEWMGTILGAQP